MSLGSDCASAPLVAPMGMGGMGGNGGFLGNEGIWAVIILAIIFGWGRNGFGGGNDGGNGMPYVINAGGLNGGTSGALTRGDLCMDMNFNGLENAVGRISDNQAAIARQTDNAICNLGYNNAQLANGIQMQIGSEFRGVDNAVCTLGFNTQNGFRDLAAQLAQCCCDLRAGIQANTTQGVMNTNLLQNQIQQCCCDAEKQAMQTRFDAQQYNCATLQAIDKVGDRIIDYMSQEKMQALRDELQTARLAASQANQNAVFGAKIDAATAELLRRTGHDCPTAAYVVQPPTPVNFPTNCCGQFNGGWGNGCGNCA